MHRRDLHPTPIVVRGFKNCCHSDRGSIERGKRADLILIDGDPTRDISTIRNVALVLQDGDAYYPAELYAELGVKPFAPALMPQ